MSDSWFNIRATVEVRSEDAAFALVDKLYDNEDGGIVISIDLTNSLPLVNITMEEQAPLRDKTYLQNSIVAAAEACKTESIHVRFDREFVWYSKIDVEMDS